MIGRSWFKSQHRAGQSCMSKCLWARYWTPHCSSVRDLRWAGDLSREYPALALRQGWDWLQQHTQEHPATPWLRTMTWHDTLVKFHSVPHTCCHEYLLEHHLWEHSPADALFPPIWAMFSGQLFGTAVLGNARVFLSLFCRISHICVLFLKMYRWSYSKYH